MIDDLERYAEISAALAAADDRARVLEAYGLTEDDWEATDDAWQARLSEALEQHDEADGVPDLLARFSEAHDRARARLATDVLPFERFLAVTRAIHHSKDVAHTLESHGVSLASYVRANQHWTMAITRDPALADQLRRALE